MLSPQVGEQFKTTMTIVIFLLNAGLFIFMGYLLYKALKDSTRAKKGIRRANSFAKRVSKSIRQNKFVVKLR